MSILRLRVFAALLLALGIGFAAQFVRAQGQGPAAGRGGAPAPPPLTMTSTSFADGAVIPDKYTQVGNQASPALNWTNVPAGTVTFFLHMHDMELARNKTTDDQVHWVVWNIPGNVTSLPEGVPAGATLANGAFQYSVNGASYRGPGAPATGPRHHYTFELFALDTKLDVQPGTDAFVTRAELVKAIQGHILGKAVYVGLFRRPE